MIKQNQAAYDDLVSHGYLRELNTSNDQRFDNHIEFGNSYFLGHAIAQVLLSAHDYLFDERLIRHLNEVFEHNIYKPSILKWCVLYAMKNDQHENLKYIRHIDLSANEKLELLVFMKDMFESKFATFPELIEGHFAGTCPDDLFGYFFGVEFISTEYEQSLKTLLKFKLSANRQIAVYTGLALVALIQLELDKLERYVNILKDFPSEDFSSFPLNPLNCLDTIFSFLKYGIIKKQALAEITRFYFDPPFTGSATLPGGINDIIYLLGVFTLPINNNPSKTDRVLKTIKKIYDKTNRQRAAYNFLFKLQEAENHFLLGKNSAGLEIFGEILDGFDQEKTEYTPLMKAMFYLLKVKIMLYTDDSGFFLEAAKPLIGLVDEAGYKLIKLQCLTAILTNQKKFDGAAAYYKTAHYQFVKTVRECGIKGDVFIPTGHLNTTELTSGNSTIEGW